jgi:hypothetical protein
MRPAFDAHQGEVLDRVGATLGAAILAETEKQTA